MTAHKSIQFISDQRPQNWAFLSKTLEKMGLRAHFFCSNLSLPGYWQNLKLADFILIYFKNTNLTFATIEQIKSLDPGFSLESKIYVITDQFTTSEKMRLSELGVVYFLDENSTSNAAVLTTHISKAQTDPAWAKKQLYFKARRLLVNQLVNSDDIYEFLESLKKKHTQESPEYQNLLALISYNSADYDKAENIWQTILGQNELFYDALNGLARVYEKKHSLEKALAIHQKLNLIFSNSVPRFLSMASIHLKSQKFAKAEHHFKAALAIDSYSEDAINGLAKVYFYQGFLEESKTLLGRSKSSQNTAAELNRIGVELVKQGSYKKAISHYHDALYVLPAQNKGARLFYNISLALIKSGQLRSASKYLKLALVKDANYEKAQNLLNRLQGT